MMATCLVISYSFFGISSSLILFDIGKVEENKFDIGKVKENI